MNQSNKVQTSSQEVKLANWREASILEDKEFLARYEIQ
jgi:hypothetical protein